MNGECGMKGMEPGSLSSVMSCSCGAGWRDTLLVLMFNVNRERLGRGDVNGGDEAGSITSRGKWAV